ncbi:right-handed parallel beta-helix repeat-containing protein [Microbulbifer sp. TRSA007]|uniref:right-handed parallel beta-helix repeat-containing protein n=1 Tax=Microbulbifer sp. TRSA007 TaxID=3243384 RepID=UPI00403A5D20
MDIKQSVIKLLILGVMGLFTASYSFVASAQVSCGDVITTAEVLTQDLSCDLTAAEPDALTIVGPEGSLSMEGFSVTCATGAAFGGAGIRIQGQGAVLTGGTIDGCFDNIFIEGVGYHTVIGTELINSVDDGIDIDSIFNIINGCIITNSGRVGVDMDDDFNTFSSCIVTGSFSDGIQIDDSFSSVFNNISTNNGGAGILIEGSSSNVITQNITTDNGDGDTADGGIVLEFTNSTNNIITGNISSGNDPFDLNDTVDPTCSGTNTWYANDAITKNPSCLD